jgi:hypothetical protein
MTNKLKIEELDKISDCSIKEKIHLKEYIKKSIFQAYLMLPI